MNKSKISILVTEPEYFTKKSIDQMRRVGRVVLKRVRRRELQQIIPQFDALVIRIESRIDRMIIDKARKLKCVVTATTGIDHIDHVALREKRIPLFSLHREHSVPTAEHTIALLFALARNIVQSHNAMTEGDWSRWRFIGLELKGRTLGVYGMGSIGTLVTTYARHLGMKVIAYDPFFSSSQIRKRGARGVSAQYMIRHSDVLTLHAKLTEKNFEFFDKKQFDAMKKGSLFINTARASLIRTDDLLHALKTKRISAAIDVYDEEPLAKNDPLRIYAKKSSNLILTPHVGGSTDLSVARASNQAAHYIVTYFS